MAETQRRPVPRNDAGELDTAMAFLTFARESVLKKTEGLTEEQLGRVMVGSGTAGSQGRAGPARLPVGDRG